MGIEPISSQFGGMAVAGATVSQATPDTRVDQGGVARTEAPAKVETRPHETEGSATKAKVKDDEDERKQLDTLLEKMNIVMNTMDIQARFSVHEATKRVMVKVVNMETGRVIREIPPKKLLDMVSQMMELVGLLVDERA